MIWTVIYKNPLKDNSLCTSIIQDIWDVDKAMSFAKERFDSDIVAIVAGDQIVHFNKTVVLDLPN